MRYFAFAALAALSIGLMGAQPANAAHDRHEASGKASYASKKAYKKASYKKYRKAAHKKAAYRKAAYKKHGYKKAASKKAYKKVSYKKAKRNSVASYGGGSHGIASYYWQGQKTASGARFNPSAMTAAHRTLPFGTRVLVTNRNNGRSVTVTINDRGPFIKGRIIDLSRGAAGVIGMQGSGLAPVSIQVLGRG
ncbi:septal ring lytic transglycosylase RlpA family protein [Hyphomicrobium sp.]|uniref:septal ring lytic transglycosylase RlpA family protein n=1 Tax=Hyphomicrobium sp. TaxID=82 RepID=UPI0025C67F7F|nr:septal ring lytic transglycosylase RlpA family protein [Hyphomicrobium sp.]MCC7252549.1 septal ring lytic transglycosylase RlpA family protein [Hyphomicrobium sp.]